MADDDEELSVDDLDELEEEASGSPAATDEDGDPPWGATMTVNDTTYAVSLFECESVIASSFTYYIHRSAFAFGNLLYML